VSDSDWQYAVLRELGVSGTGLADLRPRRAAPAPLAAPAPAAAAAWYAEGSVAAEPVAAAQPEAAGPPPASQRQPTMVFQLPAQPSAPPAADPATTAQAPPTPPGRPQPTGPPKIPAHLGGGPAAGPPYGEAPGHRQSPADGRQGPAQAAFHAGDIPVAGHAANRPSTAADPQASAPADVPMVEWAAPLAPEAPPSRPEPAPPPTPEPVSTQADENPVGFDAGMFQQGVGQSWDEPQPAVAPPQQHHHHHAAGPQMSAADLVRRNPHGDPFRRRMSRGMRRAVGATAAGDLRETTGMVERLSQPVPSCRRIAVTSIRGGAGKTTVAALVASVIAEHREDRVLALDADSGLGSLPLRLAVRADRSMRDLAAARPRTWEETAGFLTPTEAGLWVLSGTAAGQVSELDLRTFQLAAGGLSRYFSTAVIDCGAGIVAELQRGVLAAAHAQVFVTPGTVDGALSALQTLGWFVGSGYESLLSRTVVALVAHSPHAEGDADLERARQVISEGSLPVVVVPYDRHLATGAAISTERVSADVRVAASWIAAEAFTRSLLGEQP
jgi:MinD-like ATPase involved in chromosome partitioning or flagellar assembly